MVKVTTKVTGGEKLVKLIERYQAAAKSSLKVGILGGAAYPDGTPAAMIGAIHEFGRGHVPQRSFLRSTMAEKHKEWAEAAGLMLKANSGDFQKALMFAGELAAKDVQAKIAEGRVGPGLKEATIAAKAKKGKQYPGIPLVDTGVLMEAISYEVITA